MKVIINKCFGGFGLSPIAKVELIKRNSPFVEQLQPVDYYGGGDPKKTDRHGRSWEVSWEEDKKDYIDLGEGYFAQRSGYYIYQYGVIFYIKDHDNKIRTDKDIIEIVEQLGAKANGWGANLKIVEVPDDIEWSIHDYDGQEHIQEAHRTWS